MDAARAPGVPTEARDILFNCQHCASPLVVDEAAAGMTLSCQRCSNPTVVPAPPITQETPLCGPSADCERKLKENESQRTEVTGYINQLCIQLHRWKLRLQTLNERKAELEAEFAATPR